MQTKCLIDILKEKEYIKDVNIRMEPETENIVIIEYICESKDVIDKIEDTFKNENKNHCIVSDKGINNQISLVDISVLMSSIDAQVQENIKNDIDIIRKENYKIRLSFKDFKYTSLNQEKFINAMNSIQDDYLMGKYVGYSIDKEKTDVKVTLLKQKRIDEQEKQKKLDEMKQFVENLP